MRSFSLSPSSPIRGFKRRSCEAERYAAELAAISTEHGFPLYVALANLFHGQSLVARGHLEEGFSSLSGSLSMMRATGAVLCSPLALKMLAEVNGALDRRSEALDCIAEAVQIIETTDERWLLSEIIRLRGKILAAKRELAAAEDSYSEAVAVAREQGARVFELRAAIDLARLLDDNDRRGEVRDLLAPVYGWFTEGFDTLDLKEAKVLLDELA